MILIGTMVGRVYVFDYNKQTVEMKMLEAQRNASIKYLSFDSDNEQYVVFANASGNIGKNNIYDAFDTKEVETGILDVSTADYELASNRMVIGTVNGDIHSYCFDSVDSSM